MSQSRPKSSKSSIPFSVAIEFLIGLLGVYGVGRLIAHRYKEAKVLLIASVVYFIFNQFVTPGIARLISPGSEIWANWVLNLLLALISAGHLYFVIYRSSHAKRRG